MGHFLFYLILASLFAGRPPKRKLLDLNSSEYKEARKWFRPNAPQPGSDAPQQNVQLADPIPEDPQSLLNPQDNEPAETALQEALIQGAIDKSPEYGENHVEEAPVLPNPAPRPPGNNRVVRP